MILWIASWPRSGNTLVRQIIEQCFGLRTYSKYIEEELTWLFGEDSVDFSNQWSVEKYYELKDSKEIYCIKTHEPPPDDCPMIYIVRDGRDACVSVSHFYEVDLETVIKARKIKIGQLINITSWSDHIKRFYPKVVNNGCLLRFEKILQNPQIGVEAISHILKRQPVSSFVNRFDEYHNRHPHMFRQGKIGSWKNEFDKKTEELFWRLHGEMMTLMYYEREELSKQD